MTEIFPKVEVEPLDPQIALAKVFEFSAEDVEANRDGAISKAQKAVMTGKHNSNCRLAWISYGILFGIGLIAAIADMFNRNGNLDAKVTLIYLGVVAFFGLVVWVFILNSRHKLKRTLKEGKAHSVQDKILLVTKSIERRRYTYLVVANHRYQIERYSDFSLLHQSGVEGKQATLYYTTPWPGPLSIAIDGGTTGQGE